MLATPLQVQAQATTTPKPEYPKTIPIEKGMLTPFKGYLVPPYQWDANADDITELQVLRAQKAPPQLKESCWGDFFKGAFLGALTVLAAEGLTRK